MKIYKVLIALTMAIAFQASAVVSPLNFATPASAETEELAPGVVFHQYTYDRLYSGPQYISLVAVDLNNPEIEIGIGVCRDKTRETVSSLSSRANALAGINFGYFNMSDPSAPAGAMKYDGVVESTSDVGMGTGGLIAFNGNQVAFRKPGELDFSEYANARAGFPLLVYDGVIYDGIGNYDHVPGRHNRTAVGITPENILYMVVVDGRSAEHAVGMTCYELADFMQRLGCSYAMNMDGGGSTSMWTASRGIVNHPSDNRKFDAAGERRVYDAFFVREKAAAAEKAAAPPDAA